jgi:hypothetical protein
VADDSGRPEFGQWYDSALAVGAAGNQAFFGRDVLAGLVQGIEDFRNHSESRWDQYHGGGTTLLGCAMWMDDKELMQKISELESACVVVSKQSRDRNVRPPGMPYKLQALAELNDRTEGIPVEYFPELESLTSMVDGKPPLIGPGWSPPPQDGTIPTVRTMGFRKGAANHGVMPPILHAKLALLGRLWDHDEDDFGFADVTRFTGKRLWIGSANFTGASRRNLEFGFWTEDPELLRGAQDFLLKLIGDSEGLDPTADTHIPDRALPDYDHAAMVEWAYESRLDDLAADAEPDQFHDRA